jgi:hypothetical protein
VRPEKPPTSTTRWPRHAAPSMKDHGRARRSAARVEMQEIDADVSFKKNNLHDYVERRSAGAPRAKRSRI